MPVIPRQERSLLAALLSAAAEGCTSAGFLVTSFSSGDLASCFVCVCVMAKGMLCVCVCVTKEAGVCQVTLVGHSVGI